MKAKRNYNPVTPKTFDYAFAQELAQVYENAPLFEETAELAQSYEIFAAELVQQYEYLLSLGVCFEYTENDPFETADQLITAYRNNDVIKIYSGGQDANPAMNQIIEKYGISVNLIFRSVHDIMGHCFNNNNFTPLGEENAVRSHACYFSLKAFPALMLETRSQNAWVSYGPHLDALTPCNGLPLQSDGSILFPEQKYFMLPERFYSLDTIK